MTRETTRDRLHHVLDICGLKRAEPRLMADWVQGHLERGMGTQDYSFPSSGMDRVYVATRDCELPALHGALAISVLVPAGVNVVSHDLGDSRLFRMDDFTTTSRDVRIPPEVAAVLMQRGVVDEEFIYAEAEALAREMGHTRPGDRVSVEHTLGLIGAGMQHIVRPYITHIPEQRRRAGGK